MIGDCYEAAANYVLGPTCTKNTGGELYLVHGRPTLQRPPFKPYGHAWVEFGLEMGCPMVREVSNGRNIVKPRAEYYALGKIHGNECFRYNFEQTRRMLMKYLHYGPWEGIDACPPLEPDWEGPRCMPPYGG